MKVLIVGSGGREHAIASSVAKSPKVDKIVFPLELWSLKNWLISHRRIRSV